MFGSSYNLMTSLAAHRCSRLKIAHGPASIVPERRRALVQQARESAYGLRLVQARTAAIGAEVGQGNAIMSSIWKPCIPQYDGINDTVVGRRFCRYSTEVVAHGPRHVRSEMVRRGPNVCVTGRWPSSDGHRCRRLYPLASCGRQGTK